MRINLPTMILAPAVLAAVAFTALPVLANSNSTVRIPFDFMVGNKTLPAGDYLVRQGDHTNFVALQGKNGTMEWLVGPGKPNPGDERVVLTFDTIGQEHMLRTVQYGPMVTKRLDGKYANSLAAEERITGGA
jgi:hypothetical protein